MARHFGRPQNVLRRAPWPPLRLLAPKWHRIRCGYRGGHLAGVSTPRPELEPRSSAARVDALCSARSVSSPTSGPKLPTPSQPRWSWLIRLHLRLLREFPVRPGHDRTGSARRSCRDCSAAGRAVSSPGSQVPGEGTWRASGATGLATGFPPITPNRGAAPGAARDPEVGDRGCWTSMPPSRRCARTGRLPVAEEQARSRPPDLSATWADAHRMSTPPKRQRSRPRPPRALG